MCPWSFDTKLIGIFKVSAEDYLDYGLVEQRNILDDYRAAFDRDPPAIASLAVMNDSDNSKEKSVSYLDFIRVTAPDG